MTSNNIFKNFIYVFPFDKIYNICVVSCIIHKVHHDFSSSNFPKILPYLCLPKFEIATPPTAPTQVDHILSRIRRVYTTRC